MKKQSLKSRILAIFLACMAVVCMAIPAMASAPKVHRDGNQTVFCPGGTKGHYDTWMDMHGNIEKDWHNPGDGVSFYAFY